MPIEQSAGGVVITGESIQHYRLLIMIQGLITSKGRTCYSLLKSLYGLKGNKAKVLAQAEEIIATIKEEYK